MKPMVFWCALWVLLAGGQASAQMTVTLGGAASVASANDFATAVFQDSWDMNEHTDVGGWLNSVDTPRPGFSSTTFAGGIFSGVVSADPNLWLLETGLPNLPAVAKTGNSYAINASLYRIVAIRMRLAEPGYMLFLWSTNTIYDPPGIQTAGINGSGAEVPTTAGWRIYFVDLASLTLVGGGSEPWTGTKRSLRLDPAPDNATPGSVIDIDWIRLVDNQPSLSRTVSWANATGPVDIYLDNDRTATSDPAQTLGLLAQNVAGTTYALNAGALPAGTYYVAVRRSGTADAFTYSTTAYQVNGTGTVTVTSPSDEGSADDFATVQLNNAWDMTSASDVDSVLNITGAGISTVQGAETEAGAPLGNLTAFSGVSTTGEFSSNPCSSFAKPVVYPLDPAHRGASVHIDPIRYRILTMEVGLPDRPRDLCGGSIVRVGWQVAGAADWTSSWGVPLNSRSGANVVDRVNFDMAAIPVDVGGASQEPWAPGTSSFPGIAGFRVDPHEFWQPTAFFIKRIKLAALETANASYTVRWTSSKAGATIRVYYDTDQDPVAKTLVGTIGGSPASGSLVWNTANLPNGARYYVYVEIDDGSNTNGTYSKWPVVIDHPAAPPGGLTARAVGGSAIALSWSGASGATSYRVKRGTGPGTETVIASGLTGTSYVDAGRPPGNYYYVVTAVSGGSESAPSAEVFVRLTTAGVEGDVDGDGRAELTVFRPSSGQWFVRYSAQAYSAGSPGVYAWGLPGDRPIAGDVDGDHQSDLTVYRPSTGQWLIAYSSRGFSSSNYDAFQWGLPGDVPVAADFDGDGRIDLTVYRPSTGQWFIRYSSQGFNAATAGVYQWGLPGDVPLAADFDGDGRTELTIYRPATGEWLVRYSSQGYNPATANGYQWGLLADVPLVADFDGDGRTDLTVYRPATNEWFIRYSTLGYAPGSPVSYQWGLAGDLPVVLDLDGDGRTELTVYRPFTSEWLVRYSSIGYNAGGSATYQWGLLGDLPLPRTYDAIVHAGDVDGDGQSDLTIYRPDTGYWYVRQSRNGYDPMRYLAFQWGLNGDVPLAGDFDGDRLPELTVFRPSTGEWFIRYSSQDYRASGADYFQWGLSGDIPMAADLDGDGRAELIVFRPSSGQWFIRYSTQGYSAATYGVYQWGLPGDIPVAADFDGDGRAELSVYRPSSGQWFLLYSRLGYNPGASGLYEVGVAGDLPVAGDFDGDGRADLTVYRPSSGRWLIRYSSQGYAATGDYQWGLSGDIPLIRDFDGDGRAELTVYRPSTGEWWIRYSLRGYSSSAGFQWGLTGDTPVGDRQ